MSFFALFILAIGLSMDAFAVSICKGLSLKTIDKKSMVIVGTYFGVFQAIMPFIGYTLSLGFRHAIENYDHWIAFGLLLFIGAKMIKESFDSDDESQDKDNSALNFNNMIMPALATSIDAMAVGITFAFLDVDIIPSVLIIGVTTFIFSAIGVKLGSVFGSKHTSKAEFTGGGILIMLGAKILIEHLL